MSESPLPPTRVGTKGAALGLSGSAAAAVLWGFGGIFVVLTYAPALVVACYRFWLGALFLTAIVYLTGKRLSWATVRATWLGGIFLGADMMMFYSSVRLTTIVDASVIGALQPALVLIAARPLFGERMSRRDVFWIVLAMVGVSVAVIGPGGTAPHRLLGDILAAGALLSFSTYWLISKHAREAINAIEYTAGVMIFAALLSTPVVFIAGQSLSRFHAGDWTWIVLLALVPGTGHLIMNWAHRYVDASISAAISCLSPLVASLVAIPILGQSLTWLQVIGVLIGLAAIAVVAARHREPAQPPAE
ncbi:MAG: DMT family transporter [Acidimicrobiales bacterium]